MTTIDTITDEQIEAIRSEAEAAGNRLTVDICTIALTTGLGEVAEYADESRSRLEQMGIIPEHVGSDLAARAAVCDMLRADEGIEVTR